MYQKKLIDTNKSININKTYKYLIPYYTKLSKEFFKAFWNINWIGFGIDDHYNSKGLNLYCLSKIESNYTKYLSVLEPYLDCEYMYDPNNPRLNMLVFNCDKVTDFIQGNYSTMFNNEEVSRFDKIIKRGKVEFNNPTYQIITKDKNYKQIFIDMITKDFGTTIELDPTEYDYPPILENEIFRFNENLITIEY